jgi:flotillin
MGSIFVGIIGLIVLLALIVLLVVSRIKVAGPNEAFIVTGRKGRAVTNPETGVVSTDLSGQKVVMGASVFVLPVIQKLASVDLSARQISVSVGSAVSAQGIKCSLEGVAVVKVGGSEDSIRAAAQRFLGQQDHIEHFTQEVLAGSLRSIVGRLSVDEIIRDRAAFAREVAEEAESSLTNQGLVLDTFQLQDIQTEGNYLKDLGRPEAARAQKVADIAESVARREAEQARLKAEEEIAVANRELSLRRAAIQSETDAAQAQAEGAGPIAKAARDQEVIAAQEAVAERQAQLRERELDTEVRKPADAQRYAVETKAEGEKSRAIREAEAERARREAAATALRAEGEAEAAAILARGEAEATAMSKKAAAYDQYGDAAIIDLLAQMLPNLVREAAAPIAAIDKVTVISTDGASQLTKSVAGNVTQGMQLASDLVGVDLAALFQRLAGQRSSTMLESPPAPES